MKTPIRIPVSAGLWLVLWVVTVGYGQPAAPDLRGSLLSRQVAVEGRSVSFKAAGVQGLGSLRWQVAARGTGFWEDLADDGVYVGTTTTVLEIGYAGLLMDGNLFRLTVTNETGRHTTNVLRLIVAPPLMAFPVGVAVDEQGHLLVTDTAAHAIWQVANAELAGWGNDVVCPTALFAGAAGQAGARDGYGTEIAFNHPSGLAGMEQGGYLIADTANATLRHLSATRVSTTFAGSSVVRGNADGAGIAASFGAPVGIARGPDGAFYVADSTNHTIRRVTADGRVSTLAGSPGQAGFADGAGPAARFNRPTGVAVNAEGRIFVSDTTNNLIRAISPEGVVQTLAGAVGVAGSDDGDGMSARFNGPTGLALLGGNSVYIADTGNSTIRFMNEAGTVSTFAGVPGVGGLRDGLQYHGSPEVSRPGYDMLLNQPQGVHVDWRRGLIFIADTGNAAIRVISYYDGLATTLPLISAALPLPPPFTPSPPPPASNPPRTAPPPSSGGTSGGGAIGPWLLAILAGLRLLAACVIPARPA